MPLILGGHSSCKAAPYLHLAISWLLLPVLLLLVPSLTPPPTPWPHLYYCCTEMFSRCKIFALNQTPTNHPISANKLRKSAGRRRVSARGQRYIGKNLSNADKLAFVKLSAKLSISKNLNFEIREGVRKKKRFFLGLCPKSGYAEGGWESRVLKKTWNFH